MNSFVKRIIILYAIVYIVLGIFYYIGTINQLFFTSAIYAGLLNIINSFAAVKLFNVSYKKGASSFMIYNLGGLGLRLLMLLVIFVLVIKFLNIDEYGFILIFFLFYFISLIFEVIFYINKTQNKHK